MEARGVCGPIGARFKDVAMSTLSSERTPLLPRHPSAMDAREARRQTAATVVILVVLTLERLAYYALATNFFLFLNKGPWDGQAWDSLDAMNAVFILAGVSYVSALLGGYISDAKFGRFKTMVMGFLLYISGYILLTLMAVDRLPRAVCFSDKGWGDSGDNANAPCKVAVYISVTIVGLGVGIVKSNIAPFGAEQLRTANPQKTRSFFNWFYWCINLGSLVGVGVITYIEQDSPGICTNGFFCGYLIATVCLVVALILFIVLLPCYHIVPPEGSVLGNILKIIWESLCAQVRHWRYRHRNPAASPLQLEPRFLDRAKIRFGGSFHESAVDDVRSLGKLLNVFTALIPYWLVYFQMETSFQAQGLHMRFSIHGVNSSNESALMEELEIERTRFSIPAAWLTLFNQLFLIAAIPVLTSFLYPILDKTGIRVSMLFRIGVGMVFSILAVMTAGGLETYRTYLWRTDNSSHIEQVIGNVTYHAVNVSIFWQVPQYVLVGAAELFASIAGLEFAYSAAPRSFQAMIMGLFYTMEGIGSLLGTALLHLVSPFWLSNMTDYGNINDNHLDFYLYFLGVLQFTTFLVYCGALYMQKFSLRPIAMPPSRRRRPTEPFSGDQGAGGVGLIEEENEDEIEEEEEDDHDMRTNDNQQLL
ncbi:solute carrier family 15 member 4-like isoform X1 [Penaeus chinensis]|uniref:solute carrier family 15 member 4-like isoform X1 n=3 Tax=Penaeus chinensis TaxID=139456 RepID=UPI001FB750D4|nr:solute carrier family 15 member 4-like isoform X1 [Penaeus chinensis]